MKPISPEISKQIAEDYNNNMSIYSVAELFCIHPTTVSHHVKKHGGNIRPKSFSCENHKSNIADHIPIAYFAGHFDGEGCLRMTKSKKSRVYRVNALATISSQQILNFYQARFNGTIYPVKRYVNKQLFAWQIRCQGDCHFFLSTIYPYIIEKKEQCKIALDWLNYRKKIDYFPFKPADIQYNKQCKNLITQLKL